MMVFLRNTRNAKRLFSVIYKYNSRLTPHVSRFTPNVSRLTFNAQRLLTFQTGLPRYRTSPLVWKPRKDYKYRQHNNKPIELWSNKVIFEKISSIHNNPVKEGLAYNSQDYACSSESDYARE